MATHLNIRESSATQKDAADTYEEFKEFEGRKYTGMKIGRSHTWYYDKGSGRRRRSLPTSGRSVTP